MELYDHKQIIKELYDIQKIKNFQMKTLSELVKRTAISPLYKNKLKEVKELEDLQKLPLTFYDDIVSTISTFGLEKTLLEPPLKCWQTSGYTSNSKKFYFSKKDVDSIAEIAARVGYIFGLREGDVVWSLCAPEPYASGPILHLVAEKLNLREIFIPLTKTSDIIRGLKTISKVSRIDAICGTPVIYSIIGEIVNEPYTFKENVSKNLQKKLKLKFFTDIVSKIYLRDIDYQKLHHIFSDISKGFFFGEILESYKQKLRKLCPKISPREVYGSTELIVGGTQLKEEEEGLSVWLDWFIPEIAEPSEIIKAREDRNYEIESVPWWKWYSGLRGELIITKDWFCLPLIRYPTGDVVEVITKSKPINVYFNEEKLTFNLPIIKILGRVSEIINFNFPEEEVRVMGIGNLYSRQLKEAMESVKKFGKVKNWDLQVYKNVFLPLLDPQKKKEVGPFTQLTFRVIPESLQNPEKFKEEIITSIRKYSPDFNFILEKMELAYSRNLINRLVNVEILAPEEYEKIEKEIEKRIKEGKPLGQIKPKQIQFH
ncbi:MAG: hypothetical protein QW412_03545 [Candidatus Aenigmatarchaeota archaeon]